MLWSSLGRMHGEGEAEADHSGIGNLEVPTKCYSTSTEGNDASRAADNRVFVVVLSNCVEVTIVACFSG